MSQNFGTVVSLNPLGQSASISKDQIQVRFSNCQVTNEQHSPQLPKTNKLASEQQQMQSAPEHMYQPEFEEHKGNFGFGTPQQAGYKTANEAYVPYDERALNGTGKYNLDNIPAGYELDDIDTE